jgi:hypothetical protein
MPSVSLLGQLSHNDVIILNRTLGNDKENLLMRQRSSELEDAVKLNNAIRAEMLQREKYDAYVINPLFGTDIPSRRRAMVVYDLGGLF